MDTIASLAQMDKIPVGFTLDGLRALRNKQEQDQIGLEELVRKQSFEREMDPLRVQQAGLANMGAQQGLQRGEFDLGSMGRKDSMERELFDTTKQAKLKELMAGASDSETKMFENQLYQQVRQLRPGTPQHVAAMKALDFTRGAIEEKRKSDLALRATQATNATQLRLEQMRIDAGKYDKMQSMKIGFEYEMGKARNAIEQMKVIRDYAARAAVDSAYAPLLQYLQQLERTTRPAYDAEVTNTGPKPGGVDVREYGIPTTPNRPHPQVTPTTPGAQTPTQQRKPLGSF